MDESKILICHYSTKNEEWYDATKNVVWFKEDDNAWSVKFKGSDSFYHVSFAKMHVYQNPQKIDFAEIYYKDSPCFGVDKVLFFNRLVYKIFYKNGYTCLAFPGEVRIVKDTLKDNKKASGVMAYYRRVIKELAKTEEDSFMMSQFDDISSVNNESVLSLYLKEELEKSSEKLNMPVIFPFGLNHSQFKALEMAFSNRISIIDGPPGTGKTQTILNIISNAVLRKKSVAVVSNNNSATDNVFEKLEKYGYSFMCAPLGNADNIDRFFDEYNSKVPNIDKSEIDLSELNNLYLRLPSYFEKENERKRLLALLEEIDIEHKHFLEDNKSIDFSKYILKNQNLSADYVQEVIVKIKEKEKLGFFEKLTIMSKFRMNNKFFNISKDYSIILLQNIYYLAKKKNIEKLISKIDKYMKNQSLEEKVNRFIELSKLHFNNSLVEMFSNEKRSKFFKNNYKMEFKNFVQEYPIILSSTYSLAKCSQSGYLFDYLIVDESSQVNMASAILSMRVAKNIIVVGDIKQLPQIDDSSFDIRNRLLLKKFDVSPAYSYQGNSIMSSLLSLYGDRIPRQMLKEHYRCAPEIINFCNKEFYDNELIIYSKPKENKITMRVIKTVEGNFARKNPTGSGLYNQREIDEIESLLEHEQLEDIGVITPYRYQAERIQYKFGKIVEASTIHKFQGREKKTIIFSSVVNSANDFVDNDNLINVAVSRAVDKFILITSDKVAKSKVGVLSDLINYISYNQNFGEYEEGNIKSIYDILYSDYEEQLKRFRAKYPSKDYDTENITRLLLRSILKDDKLKSLDYKMHVSLRDFIRNKDHNLTDEEFKFYINPNAHVDFLIYNKMSKKPLFAIEVDGVSYHEQNEKQKNRDEKKEAILKKNNIPLLRLKTNESNERQRIVSFINEFISNE